MTTENEKLLPCPFCGGEMFIYHEYGYGDYKTYYIQHNTLPGGAESRCFKSGFTIYSDDKEKTLLTWNTRATPQPIDAWLPIKTCPRNTRVIIGDGIAHMDSTGKWWSDMNGRELQYQPTCYHNLPKPPEDR